MEKCGRTDRRLIAAAMIMLKRKGGRRPALPDRERDAEMRRRRAQQRCCLPMLRRCCRAEARCHSSWREVNLQEARERRLRGADRDDLGQ